MKDIKKFIVPLLPLLLFPALLVPYSWLNNNYIVEWLGCGCPIMDEYGSMVENNFNANDFTALFWLLISVCVTVISVFLSRMIPKEKMWLRVLYIAGMLLVSLVIAYHFRQMLLWN